MSQDSAIEWTDATWNPVTGCTKISPGCAHCYIDRTPPFRMGRRRFEGGKIPLMLHEDRLEVPLHWRKPRRVFVNSLSDLFHEEVPAEYVDQVFAVMALCPQHTFQVLTKRAERMKAYFERRRERVISDDPLTETTLWKVWSATTPYLSEYRKAPWMWDRPHLPTRILGPWPLPNVWLGVSVEDQRRADERREYLKATSAAVRFVSYEPALGSVNWSGWEFLDWLISGGESGPKARPSHPDWHRAARDFCAANRIAYFFKQWGEWAPPGQCGYDPSTNRHPSLCQAGTFVCRVGKKAAGRLLDGREWNEFPPMNCARKEV